jgi:hypothetical protein
MVKQLLVTGKIVDPGNLGVTVNSLGFQLRKAGLGTGGRAVILSVPGADPD